MFVAVESEFCYTENDVQPLPAMPVEWWIPRIIGFVVVTLILVSVRRRGEGIRHRLRRIIIVEGVYLAASYLLSQAGRTALESLLGGVVAALLVNQMMPGRSRHIPASVRRRKIAEYEMRTGKKFNRAGTNLTIRWPSQKVAATQRTTSG